MKNAVYTLNLTYSNPSINASYTYDKIGQRLSMLDRTGITYYTYDKAGRLLTKRHGNQSISYAYDKSGNVTRKIFTGINRSMPNYTNTPQVIEYSYNKANDLVSITFNGKETSYQYDHAGLLTKKIYPDNSYVSLEYDAFDRISELSNYESSSSLLSSQEYKYDKLGNKVSIITNRGTERLPSSYRYDAKNRLIKEFYKDGTDTNHSITYTYDGTGNRTEYKDKSSGLTTVYTYNNNSLNQVETVTENTAATPLTELDVWGLFNGYIGSNTISIDDVELDNDTEIFDNIYFKQLTSFSSPVVIETLTDTINLELDNESDICYTYDDNGNLIYKSQNGQGVIYLWDALNRLSDVYYVDNESVVHHQQYLYNGDGQRIYEIFSDGYLKGFFYDANKVIAEFGEDGKVLAQYIHGPGLGGDVGSLVYKEELNSANEVETSYYFYNYRGDVIDVVSGSGTVSYRYDAFGQIIEQSDNDIENNMLFSSKKFNEATGLSYFGARYYDSVLGRFISRDPLGYIDGPNGYIYVADNPLGFIDPFGMCKRSFSQFIKDSAYNFIEITKDIFEGTGMGAGLGLKAKIKYGNAFSLTAGYNEINGHEISSTSPNGLKPYEDSGEEIGLSVFKTELSYDFEEKDFNFSFPTGFKNIVFDNSSSDASFSSSITIPINSSASIFIPYPFPINIPIPNPDGYAVQFKFQINLDKVANLKNLFKKR